jgi:hypothetical protein
LESTGVVVISLLLSAFLSCKFFHLTLHPEMIAVPIDDDSSVHQFNLPFAHDEEHHSDGGFDSSSDEDVAPRGTMTEAWKRSGVQLLNGVVSVSGRMGRMSQRTDVQGEYEMVGSTNSPARFTIAGDDDDEEEEEEEEISFHPHTVNPAHSD